MFDRDRMLSVVLASLLIVFVIALIFFLHAAKRYAAPLNNPERIKFIGRQTSIHESTQNLAEPTELDDKIKINAAAGEKVVFTGHFDREIFEGDKIFFRIIDVRINIFKNGEKIYSFGEVGTYPSFSKSPGSTWDEFNSPNIKPQDEIVVEFTQIYSSNHYNPYKFFFAQIFRSTRFELLTYVFKYYRWDFTVGLSAIIAALLLVTAVLILQAMKTPISRGPLDFALYAFVFGSWVCIPYAVVSLVFPYGVFWRVAGVLHLMWLSPLLMNYLKNYMDSGARIVIKFCVYFWLLAFAVLLSLQLAGIYDMYGAIHQLRFFMYGSLGVSFLCSGYEYVKNKCPRSTFLVLSLLIFVLVTGLAAMAYEINIYIYNFLIIVSFLSFTLLHFVYMLMSIKASIIAAKKAKELELQLVESRISVMLSQIQPHFLFNALTSIRYLCRTDPKQAEDVVVNFANFLRGNLDSLGATKPIPFERELNHLYNYLSIEQVRFKSKLQVVYDLKTTSFMLPPLTLQPIVENAVRYGITKNPKGGTVIISSQEEDNRFVITVKDDGKGFDPSAVQNDGKSHIGIENVSNRLRAQCNGTLLVDSSPGKGTLVTMQIPKAGLSELISG